MSRAVWGGKDIVVSSFIGSNKVFGMSKMGKRFPDVFQQGIAFPSDVELSVGGGTPMGNDGFNGVFSFFTDNGGWRG